MSCNNYRITNTSEKIVYFNYQRCDNSSWEYQNQLLPGQSNNFYAIDGTVSYPSFYQEFVEIQLLREFPSDDTLVPNPPPYNIKQDCYRFTVSNPHIKEQTISYVNCEGLDDFIDIGKNSTLRFLCAKFVYQNSELPLDIDYEYFEPNEDCLECSTCYPWSVNTLTSCISNLESNAITPNSFISLTQATILNFSSPSSYVLLLGGGPVVPQGGGLSYIAILTTPYLWRKVPIRGYHWPNIPSTTIKVGQPLTLVTDKNLFWEVGYPLGFHANGVVSFRGDIISYNKTTGDLTVLVTYKIGPRFDGLEIWPLPLENYMSGPFRRTMRKPTPFTTDIYDKYIGRSYCITGSVKGKKYFIGIQSDTWYNILLDGEYIWNGGLYGYAYNRDRWNIFQFIVGEGDHTLEVYNYNDKYNARIFGFEVYDNTLDELKNAQSLDDLNIIISSKDISQIQSVRNSYQIYNPFLQNIMAGTTSVGYVCPEGYYYSECNNKCIKSVFCERNCLRNIDTQKRLVSSFVLNNITCGVANSGTWNILDETIETACELLQNGGGINSGGLIECGLCDGATLGTFSSLQIEYKGALQIGTKIYEGFDKTDCTPVDPGTYMVIDSTITNNTLLKNYLCDDNQCSKTLITVNTTGVVSDIQTCSICKPCCDFVGSSIFEPGCYCQDSEAFMAIDFFVEVNVQPCVYLSCPQMTVQYQINGGGTITTTGFLWDVDWGSETRYGTQWGCNVYKWAINVQNVTDYKGQLINITYQCSVLNCSFEGDINYSVPNCP